MFIPLGQAHDGPIFLIMRKEAEMRLAATAFRGPDKALAGNTIWRNFEWLLADKFLGDAFRRTCRQFINKKDHGSQLRFELTHPDKYVGWPSTDRIEHYQRGELEEFAPNAHSKALRIRLDSLVRVYPTRTLTFACEVRREDRQWGVVVHSLYPGHDVGRLDGDITKRTGLVFFDWNHPGDRLGELETFSSPIDRAPVVGAQPIATNGRSATHALP